METNDTLPLVVGWRYKTYPRKGTDWVEITAIVDGIVYARGVGDHIADMQVPDWKFDDLICDYKEQ